MKNLIESAYDNNELLKKKNYKDVVIKVIDQLDKGKLRVASKEGDSWQVNEWVKKAILLYFKITKLSPIKAGDLQFFDKIPLKKWSAKDGVRVVPHALVRKGAFVASGAILMPSYVNIGAYVDSGSLIDTWATVGSCAQVGKNVHLSGGVGLGGVLEPLQASPVIIEDDVFVGSRCIVVEGALIEQGAVLGAGCVITGSTKIIDVTSSEKKVYQGRVPQNSVVIPGTLPKDFPAGTYNVPCALIIGQRTEQTNKKTSLNNALRDFGVSV